MSGDGAERGRALYREALATMGLTVAEVDAICEAAAREDAALDRRACPTCGAPVARSVDPRQGGFSEAPGLWIKYVCSRQFGCGYFTTRKERVDG